MKKPTSSTRWAVWRGRTRSWWSIRTWTSHRRDCAQLSVTVLFGRVEGFAAQKDSALEKCSGDWILSLDADEALSDELAKEIWELLEGDPPFDGYALRRRNLFLGRWIRYGGFYPDLKLRLFRRGAAEFEARLVHETLHFPGKLGG